jgi:hypothetical protein
MLTPRSVLLLFLAPAAFAQGLPEAPEPNESPTTATPFAPNLQAEGSIGVGGDKDWYSFSLGAPANIMATTGWATGVTVDVDTVLTLYQSDGVTVVGLNDDRGLDRYSRLEVASLPANTPANPFYLLEVKHFQAAATGNYVLDLQAKPPTVEVAEGVEPNDPRIPTGGATLATIDSLHTGALSVGGAGTSYTSLTADYDFWQVIIPAPMTVEFETKDELAGAATDTVIHLTDAAFNRITFDDDGGALALSRLSFLFTTPGLYYLAVSGYGGTTGVGNYQLAIRSTPPAFVQSANACTGSAGTPTLSVRGANPTELPWLGTEFFVDETNLPASAIYFRLLGLASLPVPFDLGPLGAPSCFVNVNPAASTLVLGDPSGTGFWGIILPNVGAFAGIELHYQLAVLDPAANAAGLTTSNKAVGTLQIQ